MSLLEKNMENEQLKPLKIPDIPNISNIPHPTNKQIGHQINEGTSPYINKLSLESLTTLITTDHNNMTEMCLRNDNTVPKNINNSDTNNQSTALKIRKEPIKVNFFPGTIYINIRTIIGYIGDANISNIIFQVKKGRSTVFNNIYSLKQIIRGDNLIHFNIDEQDLCKDVSIKMFIESKTESEICLAGSLNFQLNLKFMDNLLNNIEKHHFTVQVPKYSNISQLFNKFMNLKPIAGILLPSLISYIPLQEFQDTSTRQITNKRDLFEYIAVRKSMLKVLFSGPVHMKFYVANKFNSGTWKRVYVKFVGFQLCVFREDGGKIEEDGLIGQYYIQNCLLYHLNDNLFLENQSFAIEIQSEDQKGLNELKKGLVCLQRLFY